MIILLLSGKKLKRSLDYEAKIDSSRNSRSNGQTDCGAGGGVKEAYPDFSSWVAGERIEEAKSTGAEALVTACSWCERNLTDAVATDSQDKMKVYDIIELVQEAI